MSDPPIEMAADKAALKQLKAARKKQVAAATARMQGQRRAVKAIKARLEGAELTVPEIAAATGLPVSEVLYYVATLKKYGEILEGPKAGGYYRYRLTEVCYRFNRRFWERQSFHRLLNACASTTTITRNELMAITAEQSQ